MDSIAMELNFVVFIAVSRTLLVLLASPLAPSVIILFYSAMTHITEVSKCFPRRLYCNSYKILGLGGEFTYVPEFRESVSRN